MKEISNAVNEAIKQINDNGAIQDMVTEQATKMVESLVREAFGYNSDIRKNVEKAINKAVQIDLDQVDFTKHNSAMVDAISSSFKNEMLVNQVSNMNEKIQSLFGKPEKMEYTITEFVNAICKKIKDCCTYDTEEDTEVDVSVELGICGYDFRLQVGERFGRGEIERVSLTIGSSERRGLGKIWLVHSPEVNLTQQGGLEAWLYECYAHGVVITGCSEFNARNCDLTVWDDKEDRY